MDAISGLMADFLRLIDVNAGGLRLEKGQGILLVGGQTSVQNGLVFFFLFSFGLFSSL